MDMHNLNRHEVDVAIRITENPPDLLVGRCLGRIGYSAYASAEYLQRFDEPYTLSDFDWVVWQKGDAGGASDWLAKSVVNPRIVLYTSSMSDIISAARVGMGVGLISHHIARLYPDLIEIPNTQGDDRFAVWLLTHRDLRNTARIKTFMQFMSDALRKQLLPP